jgi:hypothetical protein
MSWIRNTAVRIPRDFLREQFRKVPERILATYNILKEKAGNLDLKTLASSFSCQMQVLQVSFL